MAAPLLSPSPRPEGAGANATAKRQEIERTAQEFEAVFLSQLLRGMSREILGPAAQGPFAAYGSMLIDAYARLVSRAGGVGVADEVAREMLRMQENG